MFAGAEIRADHDTHDAEEKHKDPTRPSLTPCAFAQRGNDQLDAEEPFEVKDVKWEPVSVLAMPIQLVTKKEEHRH